MMILGLMNGLLGTMIQSMSSKQKKIAALRIRDFPYPRGYNKLSPAVILRHSSTAKLNQPMSTIKKLALLSVSLFSGLVPDDILELLLQLLDLKAAIFRSPHSDQSIAEVDVDWSCLVFFDDI